MNWQTNWHRPIDSLRGNGGKLIAQCTHRSCGHSAELDMDAIKKRRKPDFRWTVQNLRPLLRCSKCKGKTVRIYLATSGWQGGL